MKGALGLKVQRKNRKNIVKVMRCLISEETVRCFIGREEKDIKSVSNELIRVKFPPQKVNKADVSRKYL